MKFYIHLLLSATPLFTTAMARTFTVTNKCSYTIWPAIFTDQSNGPAPIPNQPTGWMADASTSVTFTVPDNWKGGRIWGRRNCDFTKAGKDACLTGGCDGGLACDQNTGIGLAPATHADFTLSDDPTKADFYDISLVDGFNIPMRIDNNKGCGVPLCSFNFNPSCPANLNGPIDKTGIPVGCNSACSAKLDSDPNNSPNCCTGKYNNAAICQSSGVQSYNFFKSQCQNAFVYAFDSSALFSCSSTLKADYTITFCPS